MYRFFFFLCVMLCPFLLVAEDYIEFQGSKFVFSGDGKGFPMYIAPLGTVSPEEILSFLRPFMSNSSLGDVLIFPIKYERDGLSNSYLAFFTEQQRATSVLNGYFDSGFVLGLISEKIVLESVVVWQKFEPLGESESDLFLLEPYVSYYLECLEWCFVGICLFLGVELYIAFMRRR